MSITRLDWDVMTCTLADGYHPFGDMYFLHLKGRDRPWKSGALGWTEAFVNTNQITKACISSNWTAAFVNMLASAICEIFFFCNRASCNNDIFLSEILHSYCNQSVRSFEIFFYSVFTLCNIEGVRCNILRKFRWYLSPFNLSILRNSGVAPTSRVSISVPLYSMECIEKCAVRHHPHVKIILFKFRVECRSTRNLALPSLFLHEGC